MMSVSKTNTSVDYFLVINPNETRQPCAVLPIVPPGKTIAAIADLSSAILAIIFVTVRVFSPTVPTPAVLSGLPDADLPVFLIPFGFVLSVLCKNRITLGRQPKKCSGYQHYKNDYSSFHNISPCLKRPCVAMHCVCG